MTDAVYIYQDGLIAFTLDGGNYGQKRCGDGSAAKFQMEQLAAWIVAALDAACVEGSPVNGAT